MKNKRCTQCCNDCIVHRNLQESGFYLQNKWLKSIKIVINSYIVTSQQLHLLHKLLFTKTRKVFMYTNIHLSNLRILLLVNYINWNATLLRSTSYTHFITWKFRLRLEEVQWQEPAPSDSYKGVCWNNNKGTSDYKNHSLLSVGVYR